MQKNKKVILQDWGTISYKDAFQKQESIFNAIITQKLKIRDTPSHSEDVTENYLITCQHYHVYTLGKSGKENNLLISTTQLLQIEAEYIETNRGGDITYHGPGQLVVYPILNLDNFFTDIHKYLRFLEEAVIQTLEELGLKSGRIEGLTGVWLGVETPYPRKICAMGVRASRWVTMHGLALNVNTDLSYFNHIVPCGITDKAVTSIEKELGKKMDIEMVKNILLTKLSEIFGWEYQKLSASNT
jgi:lipoyl(octanoyl) transferase